MNVRVNFKSGKSITLKNSSGTREKQETFKRRDGSTYKAKALVIYFGKGKKPVHYRMTVIRNYTKD